MGLLRFPLLTLGRGVFTRGCGLAGALESMRGALGFLRTITLRVGTGVYLVVVDRPVRFPGTREVVGVLVVTGRLVF